MAMTCAERSRRHRAKLKQRAARGVLPEDVRDMQTLIGLARRMAAICERMVWWMAVLEDNHEQRAGDSAGDPEAD